MAPLGPGPSPGRTPSRPDVASPWSRLAEDRSWVPSVVASGVSFLAFWGAGNARDPSLWFPLVAEAGGALALTTVAGWLLGRSRLNLAALTDPD